MESNTSTSNLDGRAAARPPSWISWGSEIVIPSPETESEPEIRSYRCFDTVYIGFHVDWQGSRILDLLKVAKEQAQEKFEPVPFSIGGVTKAILHPNGKKGGYRYHLQVGDIDLFFSNHKATGDTPNVFVEIGSFSLHESGLNTIEVKIEGWISFMGGSVVGQNLSRVDLAADFIGADLAALGIDNPALWIVRAKDNGQFRHNGQTNALTFGKGMVMLRIYDKRLELRKSRSSAKEELFNERWQDAEHPVTRVEFQLRKRFLKMVGIRDLIALHTHSNKLWEYLVHRWFRIAAEAVDRDNSARVRESKLHPFWQLVQAVSWYGNQAVERAKKYCRRNVDQLMKQAAGCLESLAIAMRRSIDKTEMFEAMTKAFYDYLDCFPEGREKHRKRQLKLAECIEFDVVPF